VTRPTCSCRVQLATPASNWTNSDWSGRFLTNLSVLQERQCPRRGKPPASRQRTITSQLSRQLFPAVCRVHAQLLTMTGFAPRCLRISLVASCSSSSGECLGSSSQNSPDYKTGQRPVASEPVSANWRSASTPSDPPTVFACNRVTSRYTCTGRSASPPAHAGGQGVRVADRLFCAPGRQLGPVPTGRLPPTSLRWGIVPPALVRAGGFLFLLHPLQVSAGRAD
jgi:hypothetical protein